MNIHPGKWLGHARLIATIVAVSLATAGVSSAVAQETSRPYFFGQHMWDGGWGFLGPFSMLLFFGVAVAVVVLLVRGLGGAGSGNWTATRSTPLEILRDRYARGEIDRTEFEERKGALGA
jgi:putative membrane protein